MSSRRVLMSLLLFAVVACDGDSAATTSTTTTTPTGDSVIAELRTADGETYRILLEGDNADHARTAYESGDAPGIPNGRINAGDGGVNIGHDWHITEVEWVDMSIEVCDGTVGYIDELGYEEFVNQHGYRFCPWSVETVDLIDA